MTDPTPHDEDAAFGGAAMKRNALALPLERIEALWAEHCPDAQGYAAAMRFGQAVASEARALARSSGQVSPDVEAARVRLRDQA